MSFIGSINAETRKWLGNNGPAFDGRQVYVGCSGNFHGGAAPLPLRSQGQDLGQRRFSLLRRPGGLPGRTSLSRSRGPGEKITHWLEPYMEDEEGKAATVMVLFEALKYEKANNLFKARHWTHYLQQLRRVSPGHGREAPGAQAGDPAGGLHLQGYFRPAGRNPERCGGHRLSAHLRRRLRADVQTPGGDLRLGRAPATSMIDEDRKKRTITEDDGAGLPLPGRPEWTRACPWWRWCARPG